MQAGWGGCEGAPGVVESWWRLVPTTGNTGTEYSHTGLPANTTRHYRVSAINTQGSGLPSEHYPDTVEASATTGSAGAAGNPSSNSPRRLSQRASCQSHRPMTERRSSRWSSASTHP